MNIMLSRGKIRIKSFMAYLYELCLDFWKVIGISVFVFLVCRYVGNMIDFFYIVFGFDLNYIGLLRIDKIYDYRYTFSFYVFIICFLLKNYNIVKMSAYRSHRVIKKLEDILVHKKDRDLLLFLLMTAIAIRLSYFFIINYYDPDQIYRMIPAQHLSPSLRTWQDLQFLIPHAEWPPLHFWLISFVYLFLKNIFVASRLVSLIFGMASIIPFYFLAKEITDKKVAFFSTLFFSLYSFHILYSVLVFADVPALFFVLMALLFFFRYLRLGCKKEIIFSAIFLNLTTMLRVEYVIILLPLFFILLIKKKRYTFLFIILASLFYFFWSSFEYFISGNPFFFFTQAAHMSQRLGWRFLFPGKDFGNNILTRFFYPAFLMNLWTHGLALAFGLIGLIYSFTKKRLIMYSFVFVFVYFIYSILVVTKLVFFMDRHVIILGMFSLVFVPLGCEGAAYWIKKYFLKSYFIKDFLTILFIGVVLAFFITSSIEKLDSRSKVHTGAAIPSNVFQTINWLKDNASQNVFIVMGNDKIPDYLTSDRARPLFMLVLRDAYKKNNLRLIEINPKFDFNITAIKQWYSININSAGKDENILEDKYFITLINTKNYLELPSDCKTEKIEDYTFICMFESSKSKRRFFGEYSFLEPTEVFFRIYKIEKNGDFERVKWQF